MFLFAEHFERYINIIYLEEHCQEIAETKFYFPLIVLDSKNAHIPKDIIKKIKENNEVSPKKELKYSENYDILRLIEFIEAFPQFRELIKPCVLKYKTNVSLIFSRPSARWGLRGDPYFWRYLEEVFLDYELPMELDILEEIIENEFFKLSGERLGQDVFIKQFSHGGMSSGGVSCYWTEVGLPLLKYRLLQSNNEYYLKNKEYSKIIENPKDVIETKFGDLEKIISSYDFDEYNHCPY